MMTVEEIKAAIEKLSPEERARLEELWGAEDEWDRQMAADAKAGNLDGIIAQVDRDIEAGNLREFP